MAAHYDSYDYPKYWLARDYEHESEVLAIKNFLSRIPKIKRIADIGCGFGRLTPTYAFRAKKITLIDPSRKLLSEAKKRISKTPYIFSKKKINFVQSKVEGLNKKFKKGAFDLVLMVRVMHHLEDLDKTIQTLSRLTSKNGYLILEFANKVHGKALFQNIMKGNFTFPIDIFPQSKLTKHREKTIAFLNYHPDTVKESLKKHNFKVLATRSVSNIRSPFLKKHLPHPLLLSLEEILQKPLSHINFGPSIFILAKKKAL